MVEVALELELQPKLIVRIKEASVLFRERKTSDE